MLIRLVLMGCPLVGADYVGTCHRLRGCNSRGNDDVGRAQTVGILAPPDLSPAGDTPICCRSMQVQNPLLESPATGFIFDNCASSIGCWSISEPFYTFNMNLFISIHHIGVNQFMCILIWISFSLLAALSSCSTPPHLHQRNILLMCLIEVTEVADIRLQLLSGDDLKILKYIQSLACISKRHHVWLKFCCKIIFTGSDNPHHRGQDVGHKLSSLHWLLEGVELPSRPQ